jgi:predicted transcriptional regulator
MKALLIHLDDGTLEALDRVAPPSSRRRSQFVREAIRRAVRQAEYSRMRQAYLAKPDMEADADDWSTAEDYKP